MVAYHPDAERLAQAAAFDPGDAAPRHHLACEILAQLPLLRAMARVRNVTQARADDLAKATVLRALATPAELLPATDFRPWLLGLQRAQHEARPAEPAVAVGPGGTLRARGAQAACQSLQLTLLRLPDRQREALVLADGANCTVEEIAAILVCTAEQARRLVRHARAALLARLAVAQRRPVPPLRPASPRRPAGRERERPAGLGATAIARPGPADELDERHAFARRLNGALFRALGQDLADAAGRRDLEALDMPEPATAVRAARTSWLRLMFIAYACADQRRPHG